MQYIKSLKPLYIYLIGATVGIIGSEIHDSPVAHYSLIILGFCIMVFGIIKYFVAK
jgi:F0F1-type ATP synthase assembly protein I